VDRGIPPFLPSFSRLILMPFVLLKAIRVRCPQLPVEILFLNIAFIFSRVCRLLTLLLVVVFSRLYAPLSFLHPFLNGSDRSPFERFFSAVTRREAGTASACAVLGQPFCGFFPTLYRISQLVFTLNPYALIVFFPVFLAPALFPTSFRACLETLSAGLHGTLARPFSPFPLLLLSGSLLYISPNLAQQSLLPPSYRISKISPE